MSATLLLATLVLLGDAQGLPTYHPGPFAVGRSDWDFGQVDVTQPGSGGTSTLSVEHFGTMSYPAAFEGQDAPFAEGRPRPFVVFAHGRFQTPPFTGHNHAQAGYLLDHLASWGFVVASVNLDVVGQFAIPSAIGQRGQLIRATVEAFKAWDTEGRIAFDQVAFVGHSRGGEGCIAAYQQSGDDQVFVRAIATIAPTDFRKFELLDVPYLSIYGSKDGDVNNGWPIFIYDRAGGLVEKAFEYVRGANHFWFTDEIVYAAEGNALITREQHHAIARTYITRFLKSQTGPAAPASFRELADEHVLPADEGVVVHPMFAAPGALVVDDFQNAPVAVNSLGLAVGGASLVTLEEENLRKPNQNLYHDTVGASITYDVARTGGTPLLLQALPPFTDVRGFHALSLRALQRFGADANPAGMMQDFRVALVDRLGRIGAARLSEHGEIPWPVTHQGALFPSKSVFRTTRIPLRSFLADNPHLDLSDLRFVGLIFDQTPSADLRIDDLAFTD